MKYNIWKWDSKKMSSTGGWEWMCIATCEDEKQALNFAKQRFGMDGKYQFHEAL